MNNERFQRLVDEQIDSIRAVLTQKGKEYSSDDDRLHNFKVAGRRRDQTPERALDGMALKHEVSIWDIVQALDRGYLPSRKMLDEKIGDAINYYILLKALIIERIEECESDISQNQTPQGGSSRYEAFLKLKPLFER